VWDDDGDAVAVGPVDLDGISEGGRVGTDIDQAKLYPPGRQRVELLIFHMHMNAANHSGVRRAALPLHYTAATNPFVDLCGNSFRHRADFP
jgi:hypothetical protein